MGLSQASFGPEIAFCLARSKVIIRLKQAQSEARLWPRMSQKEGYLRLEIAFRQTNITAVLGQESIDNQAIIRLILA